MPRIVSLLATAAEIVAAAGAGDDLVGVWHARTEGWPAGLRLAAVTLRQHSAPGRLITQFAGDDRVRR